MMPSLTALSGPLKGQAFELSEDRVTIGRHQSSAIRIPDLSVSRHHCVLEHTAHDEGECWQLRDLGSSEGTFVNGQPTTTARIKHGDIILVADSAFLCSLPADEPEPAIESIDLLLDSDATRLLTPSDSTYMVEAQTMPVTRALAALVRLGAAAGGRRNLETLGRELLSQTMQAVHADRAALLLMPDGVEVEHEYYSPVAAGFHPIQSVVDHVVQKQQSILIGEVAMVTSDASNPAGVQALAAAPMQSGEQLLGVLYLEVLRRSATLTQEHLELLVAIATISSPAFADALRIERLKRENRRLQEAQLGHGLVGDSPAMRKVNQMIARAAPSGSTVLVLGESGTGKELAARATHALSPRSAQPFVAINCATLSEELLESELFGHEKGAFTGAVERKIGKLELANGGTVLLDEIGELPLSIQAKLLRVLQERSFERVGGTRPITVDIRVIASTNKDLLSAVHDGRFRDDLYYRLNVISITMPPLRERQKDVSLLANHFAKLHGATIRRQPSTIPAQSLAVLEAYDWPGNVRELSNAVERAVALGQDSVVRVEDLPEHLLECEAAAGAAKASYHDAVSQAKRKIILDAVRSHQGNVTRAAQHLGLHPNHLHRLMTNMGIRSEL
jgi:Nif-specific regulatory protein